MAPAMRDADEALLDRAHSGDEAALDTLIERHLPALRTYVRLNVPPDVRARESCSDLVQSVCREILHARDGFEYRGPEAFRAWLFHWALHKIKDRVKFVRAEKRAPAREAGAGSGPDLAALYATVGTPSAAAIARENAAVVEQAFDRLDSEDREVIALCKIAGLPREEVARVLGKSPGAVRTHLSRALVRLGAQLQQLGVREG
jgi:RNA polymerase sigma-70 factor (ECF subfamily)